MKLTNAQLDTPLESSRAELLASIEKKAVIIGLADDCPVLPYYLRGKGTDVLRALNDLPRLTLEETIRLRLGALRGDTHDQANFIVDPIMQPHSRYSLPTKLGQSDFRGANVSM